MRTKILLLTLMLASVSALSGRAENDKRDVTSFSGISLRIPATMYIEQGSRQSIEIEARESILEDILTEVKDRDLIIRFPVRNYFKSGYNTEKIVVRVTVPEIDRLSISGSGEIVSGGNIKSRIIDLSVSGSGKITIDDLDADRVLSVVSGSGEILIRSDGKAAELSVSLSGSGQMRASDFEAEKITVKMAGSGECRVRSNGSLSAKLAGSGNIIYSGDPSVEFSVVGSGEVKQAR